MTRLVELGVLIRISERLSVTLEWGFSLIKRRKISHLRSQRIDEGPRDFQTDGREVAKLTSTVALKNPQQQHMQPAVTILLFAIICMLYGEPVTVVAFQKS